jgi:hypothetical protein
MREAPWMEDEEIKMLSRTIKRLGDCFLEGGSLVLPGGRHLQRRWRSRICSVSSQLRCKSKSKRTAMRMKRGITGEERDERGEKKEEEEA